jgi:serine/threonine protein kinase
MSIGARLNYILDGKYRIHSFIGAGGMSLVYAASHRFTQQEVAIKFLRRELADQAQITRRFLKEAETVSRLSHSHAVKLMGFGTDPEFGPYMVLELLHGESLESYLAREKTLSFSQTSAWLLPIMDMLEYAHGQGVLHRDIKPANIFLHEPTPGQIVPKLLDFGLVRVMDEALGLGTKTGQALGTPNHISPEQASGDKGLRPASDVWSMATVWYRCLSGVEPFERGSADATLFAVVQGDYKKLTNVSPKLHKGTAIGKVLDRALRVDPDARTQSMAALHAQLSALGRSAAPASLRVSGVRLLWTADPERVALTVSALALVLVGLWWAGDAVLSHPSEPQPSAAVRVETHARALHADPRSAASPAPVGSALSDAAVQDQPTPAQRETLPAP